MRKYSAILIFCTQSQNLSKSTQKYGQSKIDVVHDVDDDISFKIRSGDLLYLIQKWIYERFLKKCALFSVITWRGYRT